ncbi:hypothetical protein AX774_g4856 [Zancudomyces culisetae]|uniref:Uncharacterized protein n=1 Tax=Zancudomyces culisetae TaxID=1213189 RepID=A0A1R1PLD5_ZANCU|nr:hypothetical protein AX774_g4856 [Zancudomyces culisetae]|eukprot:OMH81682.1 hypothetical protein AX774_g4856 [Zancudomyces culisetae]
MSNSFATLFRQSKVAAFDPKIKQAYAFVTPKTAKKINSTNSTKNFGLKHDLPPTVKTNYITINQLDTYAQVPDFTSANQQVNYIKIFKENFVTSKSPIESETFKSVILPNRLSFSDSLYGPGTGGGIGLFGGADFGRKNDYSSRNKNDGFIFPSRPGQQQRSGINNNEAKEVLNSEFINKLNINKKVGSSSATSDQSQSQSQSQDQQQGTGTVSKKLSSTPSPTTISKTKTDYYKLGKREWQNFLAEARAKSQEWRQAVDSQKFNKNEHHTFMNTYSSPTKATASSHQKQITAVIPTYHNYLPTDPDELKVKGRILNRTEQGYVVGIQGLLAFLPHRKSTVSKNDKIYRTLRTFYVVGAEFSNIRDKNGLLVPIIELSEFPPASLVSNNPTLVSRSPNKYSHSSYPLPSSYGAYNVPNPSSSQTSGNESGSSAPSSPNNYSSYAKTYLSHLTNKKQ